jgi:hypothetical protein
MVRKEHAPGYKEECMEVSSSLLVAMMFVMVLSIGIGNILMGLSSLLNQHSPREIDWLPTSWVLLLLLQHLHLFWHTVKILEAEEWGFGGFLYVVAGPILLLLATSLLLADPTCSGPGDAREHYFRVGTRFFSIMVVFMLWMIGVDLALGSGLTAAGVWNAVLAVLFLVLANSKAVRLHAASTGAAWVLLLSLLIARALDVV